MKKWILLCVVFGSVLSTHAQAVDSLKRLVHAATPNQKISIYLQLQKDYGKRKQPDSSFYFLTKANALIQKTSADSVRYKVELGYGDYYRDFKSLDTAIVRYHAAVTIAEREKSMYKIALANQRLGIAHWRKHDGLEAVQYFNRAIPLFRVVKDSTHVGEVLFALGTLYNYNGAYAIAIEMYKQAKHADPEMNTDNELAILYKKLGHLDEAEKYYNKNIAYGLKHDSVEAITSLTNLALLKKDLKQFDEAERLINQSVMMLAPINDRYLEMAVRHNRASILLAAKKYDSAMVDFNRSDVIAKDMDIDQLVGINSLGRAKIFLATNQLNKAEQAARLALRIAKEQHAIEAERDAQEELHKIYKALGKFTPAYSSLLSFKNISDSLLSEERSKQLTNFDNLLAIQQKEREIDELKDKADLGEMQKTSRYYWMIALSIGIVSLGAILLYTLLQNTKLKRLSMQKNELVAMVAHDLKSPLNQIKGLMSIYQMDPRDEYLHHMDKIVTANKVLIDEILNKQLLENEKLTPNIEPVDLHVVLKDLVEDYQILAQQKKIEINLLASEPSIASVDKIYTQCIFSNLISNAIKYSPANSRVEITIQPVNGSIVTSLKDQGPGIQHVERIFERYTTTTNKPTGDEKSNGLGLAVVKKYVESMKGKVECKSEIGAGATFVVKFNRAKSKDQKS